MLANRQPQFESPANQQLIAKALFADFNKSEPLTEEEYTRLPKMIRHYIAEVRNTIGPQPITILNREVMRACAQQVLTMRKKNSSPDDLAVDTARRFEQLQNDRNSFMKKETPAIPNFLIEATEDKSNAMELFQRAKAMREEEMKVAAQSAQSKQQALSFAPDTPGMQPAIVPGRDDRFFNLAPLNGRDSQSLYQPNGDPTIIKSNDNHFAQQDLLQRKDDILTYKENEYNLFINSIDRNWYYDTALTFNTRKENRYDFVVNFNPANNKQGFAISPAAQIKFKNISRIELVKVIMPSESVDNFKTRYGNNVSPHTTFNGGTNVLSFPYLSVHVDELESNNYGTNNTIDNAFGLIQYDNKWSPEPTDYREYAQNALTVSNPGYVCMIPKFMKCQREYYPTPMSSLSKMTIRIERPDGNILNEEMDTFDFIRACMIDRPSYTMDTSSPYAAVGNPNEYVILESSSVFRATNVVAGDRIYIQGFSLPSSFVGGTSLIRDEFVRFINRKEGHIVSAVQGLSPANIITDAPNVLGYSKFIVIEGLPVISSGTYYDFSSLSSSLQTYQPSNCRGINANRQVQLVFRIITRDIDSSTRIRPDIV